MTNAFVDRHTDRKGDSLFNLLAILSLATEDESRLGVDRIITRAANINDLGPSNTLFSFSTGMTMTVF